MNATCNRLKHKLKNKEYEICVLFFQKNDYDNFYKHFNAYKFVLGLPDFNKIRAKVCFCVVDEYSSDFHYSTFQNLGELNICVNFTEKLVDLSDNLLNLYWTKNALKFICMIKPNFFFKLNLAFLDKISQFIKFDYFEANNFNSLSFSQSLNNVFRSGYFEEFFNLKRTMFKSFEEISAYFENNQSSTVANEILISLKSEWGYEFQGFGSYNFFVDPAERKIRRFVFADFYKSFQISKKNFYEGSYSFHRDTFFSLGNFKMFFCEKFSKEKLYNYFKVFNSVL